MILERAYALKQAITDFILDAEGELAQALEKYAAAQSQRKSGENIQQGFIIDSFITEGKVGNTTALDLFLANHPEISEIEHQLINNWHRSFIGLFAITNILPDGFELMNWLSAKHYIVKPNNAQTSQEMSRLKAGDILVTRIYPVTDSYWMFSGFHTLLGKLGKPKLAVAIGNFKENYKHQLYSDAPELLAASWESVEQYHQQFVDFFGSDEITLPGYQLNKKMAEFQEVMTQKTLAAAGIDSSKSLQEMAAEAGLDEAEIAAAAQESGVDKDAVAQMFNNKSGNKMVMPKMDLPAEIKQAEQVTAISHPCWGQKLLPTYMQVKNLLEAEDWQSVEKGEKLIRFYLQDESINVFIWQRLAQQYPVQLEKVLQQLLQRPNFKIETDLNALMQEFHKPLEPELPEMASVPVHLHNLFEEAVMEVNKSNAKGKSQKKANKGFQRG